MFLIITILIKILNSLNILNSLKFLNFFLPSGRHFSPMPALA
jgi:hypothetical protein